MKRAILNMFLFSFFLLGKGNIRASEAIYLESKHIPSQIILPIEYSDGYKTNKLNHILQINIEHKNDLLFDIFWWHFSLGVRRFNLVYSNTESIPFDLINLFHYQTQYRSIVDITDNADLALYEFAPFFIISNRQFICMDCMIFSRWIEYPQPKFLPIREYIGATSESINNEVAYDKWVMYRISPESIKDKPDIDYDNNSYIAQFPLLESESTLSPHDYILDPLNIGKIIENNIVDNFNNFTKLKDIIRSEPMHNIHQFCTLYPIAYHFRFGYKYAFALIQKNASSTLNIMLNSYEIQKLWTNKDPQSLYYSFIHPLTFHHDRYERLTDETTFKFTIVRNPYVRILSAYLDKLCTQRRGKFNLYLGFKEEEIIPFKTFLLTISTIKLHKLLNHFMPMWILCMYPVIKYDYIARMENILDDLDFISKKLGIKYPTQSYTHRNHATNAINRVREYYDSECIDLVKQIYQMDFDYFGYSTHFNF